MKTKFLAGLLLGAAAGAVLGILFAPDKGSETRKKITKKGKELGDEFKEKFTEISEQVKGLAEEAKTKLS